jgi:hypothetical protein
MLKKIITLMLLCLIAFNCFACTPPNHFYYDNLKKWVTRVELIKCAESEEQSVWYPRKGAKQEYKSFDYEKMELVEVLSADKIDDFLKVYCKIKFVSAEEEMNMPEGWCVRLLYKDAFHVISLDVKFARIYRDDGISVQLGSLNITPEYRDILVNNFFETQI